MCCTSSHIPVDLTLDHSAGNWKHSLPLSFHHVTIPFQNLKQLQIVLQINYKHYLNSYTNLLHFLTAPPPSFPTFPIRLFLFYCSLRIAEPCHLGHQISSLFLHHPSHFLPPYLYTCHPFSLVSLPTIWVNHPQRLGLTSKNVLQQANL